MFEKPAQSQESLSETQKEERLRKGKILRIHQLIQKELMLHDHALVPNDNEKSRTLGREWLQNNAEDFSRTFNEYVADHPDIVELYEQDSESVTAAVMEKFFAVQEV